MKTSMLIVSIIILLPFGFFAQDEHHETGMEEEHHFHHNHIALFVGASTFFERDHTIFTMGADYARRFSRNNNFSWGLFAEAIFAHHTEWVLGALITYTSPENFWFRTGPGIEFIQEEIGETGESESKTEFLYRLGAGYKIHFGRFIVDPSVDLDLFRNSETLVWGVNFGMGL